MTPLISVGIVYFVCISLKPFTKLISSMAFDLSADCQV